MLVIAVIDERRPAVGWLLGGFALGFVAVGAILGGIWLIGVIIGVIMGLFRRNGRGTR